MKPTLNQNIREREEIEQRLKSFSFSNPEPIPKLIILLSGKEGSGKTHLACTMNEFGPVYLIDTEYRAQMVTQKFNNVRFTVVKNYNELVTAVKFIVKNHNSGTIVIDSGSDIQTFAEIEYLERTQKDKVYPIWNWSEVWKLCNSVVDEIKFSQKFNLVITSRLKDEYVGDKTTGNQIPRIYSVLPYKADIALQFTMEREQKLIVTKNGFSRDKYSPLLPSLTLPQIIKTLSSSNGSIRKAV